MKLYPQTRYAVNGTNFQLDRPNSCGSMVAEVGGLPLTFQNDAYNSQHECAARDERSMNIKKVRKSRIVAFDEVSVSGFRIRLDSAR